MTTEAYLTVADVAAEFNVSTATVYRRVESGTWPCSRFDRIIRFSPEQVDQIRQAAVQEPPVDYDPRRIRQAMAS